MDPRYEPYIWLSVSVLVAILVDYLVVRVLLDFVRPVTAYVFWVGRSGKLVSLLLWSLFVTKIWYPRFLNHGEPLSSMGNAIQWAIIGVVALLAAVSVPRGGAKGAQDA